jgi:hypothetical protein
VIFTGARHFRELLAGPERISSSILADRRRHRHPEPHGRCPAHAWQAAGVLGVPAPPAYLL